MTTGRDHRATRVALGVLAYIAWTALCGWVAWWGVWTAVDTTCISGARGDLAGVAAIGFAGVAWAAPLAAWAVRRGNAWAGLAAALIAGAGVWLAVSTYLEPGRLCW
ncbi:Uncharacterised protein (plasmid) [Tsukamurella tyrosinosolvens]|uniref:Uncharacterized protein n=1 Tax=Tsukamurella tyrosinosolvens TaxID=57704 RepID=A0A1H4X9X7_TSUTY|nr:hypothetical protein [Tsukamurella tyrosinosolvens]KXO99804.1 hypothetical protein AXK58_00870 [Tsukamurella tyrosinosolvens]SED02367.1 hypothetical protein SAMN04489793_3764 [Tsukamurella tyrosinosolvens]VEH98196.1 Uncharacterised protein [Tsukamurella tyrosinosolvens]